MQPILPRKPNLCILCGLAVKTQRGSSTGGATRHYCDRNLALRRICAPLRIEAHAERNSLTFRNTMLKI